jgi:glycosyltransferase involved in cell wall biosynthesis
MDEREWIEKLSILIEDADLRRDMGLKGRERVRTGFSLQECGKRICQLLENVASSREGVH